MKLPDHIALLDSLGDLQTGNTSPILVCGSHCGGTRDLARHVKSCRVKAVFLNNAGVGKNQAGIRGLTNYEAENILACAVDHNSAEIGIARDTWESGIVSHTSAQAEKAGVCVGDTVKEAVTKIINIVDLPSSTPIMNRSDSPIEEKEESYGKVDLKKQTQIQIDGINITVTDSITFLNENNAEHIVVCGSHGGLSAGEYALKYRLKAVFFNDAGIGKNMAGVKSLELLNHAGIIACTVNSMSAEIFNGHDVLENGIISACNQLATTKNIKEGMMVKEVIRLI